MEQKPIRPYNNNRYSREEGATIIAELDDRTKYSDESLNSMQLQGERIKNIEQTMPKGLLANITALKAVTGAAIGAKMGTESFHGGNLLGGAVYKKVDPTGLTANDMDIVEATDGSYWQLAETERVTPYMFGCRTETATDTARLQRFFDYCEETKAMGDFRGNWIVNDTIEIKGNEENIFIAGTIKPVQTGLHTVIRITMAKARIIGTLKTIGGSLSSDGGTSGTTAYADRTSLYGVVFDNSAGRNHIDGIEASGFKRWGVDMNQQGIEGESSILDWIGNIRAWNCGSASPTPSRTLNFNITAFTNNGGSGSPAQTSTLTVDVLDNGLEDGSVIKIGSRIHYIIEGTINEATKTFDVFPWVDETLIYPQEATSMHGGGLRILGNNTANIKIDQVDSIGSGSCVQFAGLYGADIGVLQSQFSSSALTIGSTRTSANIGGNLNILYTEGDAYSVVQLTEQPNLVHINSVAPDLYQDKIYIFQRQITGGGSTTDGGQQNAMFSVNYKGVMYSGGLLKAPKNNTRNKSVIIGNAPHRNEVIDWQNTKSITVKWDEGINKAFGYESFNLKVFGNSQDNPTGNITLNVDATDASNGITIMGGSSYVLPKGSSMANYFGWFRYASKDWRIIRLTHNPPLSGTTANRPTYAAAGEGYYNTTLARMEWWNGTTWVTSLGTKRVPKELNIGNWDMTSTFNILIPHGLSATEWKTIKDVGVEIRNDDDTSYITSGPEITVVKDATNLDIQRVAADRFDSVDFDAASYNRGTIRFTYIPD